MSSKFAVLGKALTAASDESLRVPTAANGGEYKELVRRLFQGRTAVAVVGSGMNTGVTTICKAIACELSRLGRRVVLVSVNTLLQSDSLSHSENPADLPTKEQPYWYWPPLVRTQMERVKPHTPGSMSKNWLDSLRRDFDAIVLDCPPLITLPGSAAIAAMADSTVLAVDAQRTPKHQILLDQRLLVLSNVHLAGCILVKGN
jgi:Mrp family chromosome partitioning ATPase